MTDRISADQSELITELLTEDSGLGFVQTRGVQGQRPHFRWGFTADWTADRSQGLTERNQLLQRWQGNLRDPFDARLLRPMHHQQSRRLAASKQRQGGRGAWMAEGPLPFHEHQPGVRQRRRGSRHRSFNRPSGVIHAHRIQRNARPTDQDPSLTGADKG